MAGDFILDDEYIAEMAVFFTNTSEKAELQLNRLTETLEATCQVGIMEGSTADNLKLFTERVGALRNLIKEYGTACSDLLTDFVKTIDDIDKLY